MRARIALTALAAAVGAIVVPAVPASAAPIDDCRGLRMVCIFADGNLRGTVVWTGVESGSYNAPYRTRTTGSSVLNASGMTVQLRAYSGGGGCYIPESTERHGLPRKVDNNIGKITLGSGSGGLPRC